MDIPAFEELVKQIKINFWLIGIPFNDVKLHFRFYLLLFSLMIMVAEECGFLFVEYSPENLLEITELTPCTCIGILSALKIISITPYRHKIFKLTESLNELYSETLENQAAKKLITKKIILMKNLVTYYFVLNVVLVSVYNFSSVVIMSYTYIKTGKTVFYLSYAILVPFSIDTWPTWSLAFIHAISSGYICVLLFTTIDALYYVLSLHICNNFSLLAEDIRCLNETNSQNIRDIVKKHQHLLKKVFYQT
ncbi:unnamed protein product [Chilo suppressalis]|uniref:Odorant receptor n=1 Tax=Chilo suppressalis TaxID=168631 RepID=A0ABN8ATZ4_CHISP|nr:hypothetical protein evm_008860 [Chilo suppressalis]CAH0399437.1 unnamed protein product [Chilo suppressalis]